ncbi:hypothetical protein H7Y40_02130, partial [Pedobacter sp.]|nr:hypothetical protein [Candidatus Saccharibacteria bacterium]
YSYGFANGAAFTEEVQFECASTYDEKALDSALFLSFILVGSSYYKLFSSADVELATGNFDSWQADFFNSVYQEGLSQFAFENNLTRSDLAHFNATCQAPVGPSDYAGSGVLVMQSGGKDSLLTATLLKKSSKDFVAWYVSSGDHYPKVLDTIGSKLVINQRSIDTAGLTEALRSGGKNGHVPITYIIQSFAVIQAILLGKSDIITSIAHEGEEPHGQIGDLSVTHQWSKMWSSETSFADYVSRYISPNIRIGSGLRSYSELRVAELFVTHAWAEYGHRFSSCNIANYQQGSDNSELKWCGDCPKCANSYLLFAPFLPASELKSLFNNQDLFAKQSLELTFKGLLGIGDISKPFECIGEIEELRLAYHLAQSKGGYQQLSFSVPESTFDYRQTYPAQDWAVKMLE